MIKVRNISMYKEVIVEHGDVSMILGLLDKTEAANFACELISAAEDLLSIDYDTEERSLQLARESIELDQDNNSEG